MDQKTTKEIPTVFVILGATGDLTSKKVVPALYQLFQKNKLPNLLNIIGFSRRGLSDSAFRVHVLDILKENNLATEARDFLSHFSYHQADFDHLGDFRELAKKLGGVDDRWGTCSNKLFYLAVPPRYYKVIFKHLADSGLTKSCGPNEGWTRVIVEKPFGNDYKTAEDLDALLGKLFKEEQIYRIDHYLGKEMLQNILTFRFSNSMFEQSWSNKYIERIDIRLLETKGVEERGAFYESVGALRDVGQNHLLQMLALVTMTPPATFDSESIRAKRAEVLSSLSIPDEEFIKSQTFRAQYKGYRQIKGVASDSRVETYFKVKAFLDLPEWRGVPITLESGKRMGQQVKDITIVFKHPTPCLCPPGFDHNYKNKVTFSLEPEEKININLWSKKPGFEMEVQKRSIDFPYRKIVKERVKYTQEYQKLLLDCIAGDQTLFVSTAEVSSMWRYVDPIVEFWSRDLVELSEYEPDSGGVAKRGILSRNKQRREIGVIGLGKMGAGIVRNLLDHGWQVVGFNRSGAVTEKLESEGMVGASSPEELVKKLSTPRVIWLMIPAGSPVEKMVIQLAKLLEEGDVVIDGGNSFYKESQKNAKVLSAKGISFVDVGVSGGPSGARNGACLMVGGKQEDYKKLLALYRDLSVPGGHEHFEGLGAGHFVKMVHNGIEYGMMQAIAEGFDIMKSSDYQLHLKDIAGVYNRGSVIESRLIDWLGSAFEIFGDKLKDVSGAAGSGGSGAGGKDKKSEGVWTLEIAKSFGVSAKVIEASVEARRKSREKPSYQGKIINVLRNQFGGHSVSDG